MKIAYLYYDLLNLYGESGNIKMIEKILTDNKIKHKVLYLSLKDDFNFDDYDLVYIGSGTEENQKVALNHLLKYKKQIKKYIDNEKYFFVTGNSLDMFGKSIAKDEKINALGIFNYTVESGSRKKKDVIYNCNFLSEPIYGFINNDSYMKNNEKYLFGSDGINYKNFYGTYVLGPILVRNPSFLIYLLNKICGKELQYDLENEINAREKFSIRYKNNGKKQ